MATARVERLVNLVLCLLSTRQYLTAERIRATVPGYAHAPTDEAFFRMFERDKAELRDRQNDWERVARLTARGVTTASEQETARAARDQMAAAEEAAGAGLTRFSLLVTATVTDPALLPHVADLIDQAGGASRLQLRRVYAGQSAAFAACLGIGLVLSSHVAVPAVVRQYL